MQQFTPPPPHCPLCPRLVAFRAANQQQFPEYFNGAVPPFGPIDAEILIVGLAPGLKGANATGRPFTGDYAGDVLYSALKKHGLAEGEYDPAAFHAGRGVELALKSGKHESVKHVSGEGYPDGFSLRRVRITNAVRCVPPENKPTPAEEKTCNLFLIAEMAAMPKLKLILSLGLTSHNAVLRTFKLKVKDYKFAHGALHDIGRGRQLLDSYHTSRYNVSTGRLTQAMFDGIIAQAKALL